MGSYLAVCATSDDLAFVRAVHTRLEETAGSHAVVASVEGEIPHHDGTVVAATHTLRVVFLHLPLHTISQYLQ